MSAHKQRWPALQSLPHIRQPVPIDRMSGEYGTTNEQSTQPRTDHYKWHKRSCGKARRLMMENNVLCDMPCRMWKREESLRPIQSHSLSSSVHQGPRGFWYIQKIMIDTSGTLTACPANWRSCGSEKSSKGQNSTHKSQQNIDTDLLRQSLQLKRNYKAIPLSRLNRWRAKDEREEIAHYGLQ